MKAQLNETFDEFGDDFFASKGKATVAVSDFEDQDFVNVFNKLVEFNLFEVEK